MTIYLTDGAQELADSLREGRQRVVELIEIYDRWPEEQAPPARAGGDAATDEMLRSVRRRMGIAEEGVNEIEDIGDALNAVLASPSHQEWAEWHQAKLRAIRGSRPKKLVALRHFTEADFSDAAVVNEFLTALDSGDQTLAIAFADRAASCIDPQSRPDLIDMVTRRMQAAERAGSRSAALFAATLQMVYDKRADAIPADEVLDSAIDVVTSQPDPASLSAITELVFMMIARHDHWAPVLKSLQSSNPRRWLLAIIVIGMAVDDSVAINDNDRLKICAALKTVRQRLGAASVLSDREIEWLDASIQHQIGSLCK